MPTSEGKIYRLPNETTPKGISLDDVGRCLGMSSRDLGTLCQGYEASAYNISGNTCTLKEEVENSNEYAGRIKAWSKSKPVWFQGLFPNPSDSDYATKCASIRKGEGSGHRKNGWANAQGTSTSDYFKTVYGIEVPTGIALYGSASGSGSFIGSVAGDARINIPSSSDPSEVMSDGGWLCGLIMDGHALVQTNVVTLRWRYEPPLSAPLRFNQLFFDDYDHNSVNPMPKIGADNKVYLSYNSTDNTINFTIIAEKPVIAEGNITLAELNSAIKSGWTTPAGATVAPVIKVNNVAKGIEDMYLCAVVYHTHWSGDTEDSVIVDFALWGSSTTPYGNGTSAGCNSIVFKIPNFDSTTGGVNLPLGGASSVEDFFDKIIEQNGSFPYGQGDDGTGHPKEWRVKFFWCTTYFDKVNGGLHSSNYVLLRGNDDFPAGQVIVLKDSNDVGNQPYVEIMDGHSIVNEGNGYLTYSFNAVLRNPTDTVITNQLLLVNMYYMGNSGIDTTHPNTQSNSNTAFTVSKEQPKYVNFVLQGIPSSDNVAQFLVYFRYRKSGSSTDYVCGAFLTVSTIGTLQFFDIQYIGEASAERYKKWSVYSSTYTPLIG